MKCKPGLILAATIMIFSSSAFAENSADYLADAYQHLPCYGRLLGTLTAWSPEYSWKSEVDSKPFEKIRTSPISGGGSVWVAVNSETHSLEARKTSAESKTLVDWTGADCVAHTELKPTPSLSSQDPKNFADQDLFKLLKNSPQGVIYVYSDRMHLSVSAKPVIEKIGKDLNIPVLILVDPESPTIKGVKMGSADLFNRGMTLHYPSLVVYSHGKISSPMLPGYKSESFYKKFIQEHLK